eukprot:5943353-Pleurochrysis_carterae.AAC.2
MSRDVKGAQGGRLRPVSSRMPTPRPRHAHASPAARASGLHPRLEAARTSIVRLKAPRNANRGSRMAIAWPSRCHRIAVASTAHIVAATPTCAISCNPCI